jgi:phage shock protein PspC (stress-responsive transcriptional regulator)
MKTVRLGAVVLLAFAGWRFAYPAYKIKWL